MIPPKGEMNGECNISRCSNQNATWYNFGSRAYYCKSCAFRLNADPFNKQDAMRMFGHDLCIEGYEPI